MNAPSFEAPASEWLVYADWLQQQGKPLGEFIVLVNSGDEAKRDAWLAKNAAALLGDGLAKHFGERLRIDWRWGLIATAHVTSPRVEVINELVDALLTAPIAERMTTLSISAVTEKQDSRVDLSSTIATLAQKLPPSVALELIDHRAARSSTLTSRDFEPGENLVTFGPLTALWSSVRSLKLVVADVTQVDFGTVNAPNLESLTVHGLRLARQAYGETEPSGAVTSLGAAVLPKLKHFDMRLNEEWTVNYVDDTDSYTAFESFPEDEFDQGYSEGADWPGEFGPALRTLVKCKQLESLALTNFASTESLLELIGETGLPPALRVLDLSQSSLASGDVEWFTKNKYLFEKLDTLVVRETGFTEADVTKLRAVVKNVDFTPAEPPPRPEWEEEEEEGEEREPVVPLPKYRYTVGME